MDQEQLRRLLDDPGEGGALFQSWGVRDLRRAHENVVRMATAGVTLDLLGEMLDHLSVELPRLSDADMALNNLERFVAVSRNPLSLAALFQRDPDALPILLKILSTSQHLSDLLVHDAEAYDLLRLTEGKPVPRQTLVDEICAELAALPDESLKVKMLRRFKRREILRIAYGDIVLEQSLPVVTAQISHLADALVEGAVQSAREKLASRRGEPRGPGGRPCRFVVLGMGKLGGGELNYSSDIDLIFLYESEGATDGPRAVSNTEYFDQLGREIVRLLSEATDAGYVYRVDLRLRPEGKQGPLAHSVEAALRYYDVLGRTWERQAYVKARPVAGDLELGNDFLKQLEPWIYRRYLGLADIAGIKSLKRRIEQRTVSEGGAQRNVKTGHGGIRDVEFVIQFLQLLNGGDLPEIRVGNTLLALDSLEKTGCLTHPERIQLEENYSFLRKIEHRLQIMFDLQTHELPVAETELRKLAIRLGYVDKSVGADKPSGTDKPGGSALAAFLRDLERHTAANRKILDHLLHDAFGEDAGAEPEVDLILDPDPPPEQIETILRRYGFRDPQQAYRNLQSLATERIPFLSTRRCRHFLASNAAKLLQAVSETADPDATLVTLENVSDSLGGKGVLWELFNFNPPTLKLYVDLCASSPYLSAILTSNPGMIDELMDSLLLDKLPTLPWLRSTLAELCRGAEDLQPILHSFKNAQLLRIGIRDILAKEDVANITRALSDVALACLEQIVYDEYRKLVEKLGEPRVGEGEREGQRCGYVILALGKFGGSELNYHSDLDLVFLFEADGATYARSRLTATTSNGHFFGELGQRIIKAATYMGPYGRLYDVDARLRPTGRSGALATSLAEFARYFASGEGAVWERQSLCKARVAVGTAELVEPAEAILQAAALNHDFTVDTARAIRQMRQRLEDSVGRGNLKRGPGGLVDIEFLVQMLQLKHGRQQPGLRIPNTLQALAALSEAELLSSDDGQFLAESYRFLRRIEARLRLMYSSSRDELPQEPHELDKLARQLGYAQGPELLEKCQQVTRQVRERFVRIVERLA